jgi:hypothetical protein
VDLEGLDALVAVDDEAQGGELAGSVGDGALVAHAVKAVLELERLEAVGGCGWVGERKGGGGGESGGGGCVACLSNNKRERPVGSCSHQIKKEKTTTKQSSPLFRFPPYRVKAEPMRRSISMRASTASAWCLQRERERERDRQIRGGDRGMRGWVHG